MNSINDTFQSKLPSALSTWLGNETISSTSLSPLSDLQTLVSSNRHISHTAHIHRRTGDTTSPPLDPPHCSSETVTIHLERLLAQLQLEVSEQQMTLIKERIASNQQAIHQRHELQMEKLQASLEDAAKAETSSLVMRVFSGIFTALSVVVAGAACVASGGGAVPAVVGAIFAVGVFVAGETGACEVLADAMSDSIRSNFDCGKQEAAIASQIILGAVVLTASIGVMVAGGIGGAAAVATRAISASSRVATQIQQAATVANLIVGIGATGAQGYTTVKRYQAGATQADATEMGNMIALLNRVLKDEEADLKELLTAYQSTLSALSGMIEQDAQTQKEILSRIGAMA